MSGYTPDYRGTRRYLQYSPELRRMLHRRAILGLGVATALAPRRTGELAASGEVRDDGPNGGANGDRMSFSIHFGTGHALPASFGTQWMKAQVAYLEAAIQVMQRGR